MKRLALFMAVAAACTSGAERRDEAATREPADAEALKPGSASPLCFRSAEPLLSRLADGGARSPGWIRIEGGSGADSGQGRLVDPGGATLALAWSRTAGDSLLLRGADDLVRFDAQLAMTDSGLSGPARLFSDAQLDRGVDDSLHPAQSAWSLRAEPALCDSVPVPWTDR